MIRRAKRDEAAEILPLARRSPVILGGLLAVTGLLSGLFARSIRRDR
jgi:hypothetical protein